ncbi:MAG: hypothetical protein PHP35_00825 [Candidatus Colwellbacteria bacterium]|nr:hypothetical protein [Candidatus Colwellbacteria bacterium]
MFISVFWLVVIIAAVLALISLIVYKRNIAVGKLRAELQETYCDKELFKGGFRKAVEKIASCVGQHIEQELLTTLPVKLFINVDLDCDCVGDPSSDVWGRIKIFLDSAENPELDHSITINIDQGINFFFEGEEGKYFFFASQMKSLTLEVLSRVDAFIGRHMTQSSV